MVMVSLLPAALRCKTPNRKYTLPFTVDEHKHPQQQATVDNTNSKSDGTAEKTGGTGGKDGVVYNDKSLEDVIDYVLNTMDHNKDGYVDYAEYRKSEEANAV